MLIQFRLPSFTIPSGVKTVSWNRVAAMSAGHAIRFQNDTGMRLPSSISGMPIAAKIACLSIAWNGPPAAVVAVVADRTMTRPKPVRIRAVDRISRNSLGTGANTRPSDSRATIPREERASSEGVPGIRVDVVVTASPFHSRLHRIREPAPPVGVRLELVEGCRGGGEQNDVPVTGHPGR